MTEDGTSVITALKPIDAAARRWSVEVNGTEVAKIGYERLTTLRLQRGTPWTAEIERAVTAAAAEDNLREYALRVLARHPCSRARMDDKLRRRGGDDATRAALLDDLERMGILDDPTLADSVVRSELTRQPAGQRLLEQKLIAKGIDRGEARRAVDDALDGRDPLSDALEAGTKKLRSLQRLPDVNTQRRRLYAFLARRGFDGDTCAEAVRRLIA
ncbi:MAG: regulatory protein RecX, partial [Phycisphaerales bacterium]|nr:regulatory protein RecX [Phycisphaerales bacterium]